MKEKDFKIVVEGNKAEENARLLPRLFVIMPFGQRSAGGAHDAEEIDFDDVYKNLISYVARNVGYEVLRIDEVTTPGRISDQYLSEIYEADVVVADVTLPNANVFYELGIRQAVSAGPSILIARNGIELPFDLRDQRVLMYEIKPTKRLHEARERLKQALTHLSEEPGTNPVQTFLRKIGASPSPIGDMVGFEHDLRGRIDRARNVNQLVAVWNWAKQFQPLPPLTLIQLAERLADESEWTVAAKVVRVALDARPNDFELHRQYAWYLRHQGPDFYEEAERSFRKALDLNPSDPESLGMLGGLLKRQERFEEAATCYDYGAQISPDNLYMKVNRAAMELLATPSDPDHAITHYGELLREILQTDVFNRDEWTELVCGEAEFVLGDLESAKSHFAKAVQMSSSPNNLLSPTDQIELFGKKGFRTKEAAELAAWLRSLYKNITSEASLITSHSDQIPERRKNLPVLIHLSDIHFGTRIGPDGDIVPMHRFRDDDYSMTLSEHLRNEFASSRKHFKIDNDRLYLIVTGDLTYTGAENEFKDVTKFLVEFCKDLNIKRERVVICPGNHDVDWKTSQIDRRFDNYLAFLFEFYGMELFRELYPLVTWDFRVNSPRPKPIDIISRQVFPKDGLLFLSLNSCVYETEEHHYGYVSGSQLRNCTTTLDGFLIDDSLVRIVIMHHHLHQNQLPVCAVSSIAPKLDSDSCSSSFD